MTNGCFIVVSERSVTGTLMTRFQVSPRGQLLKAIPCWTRIFWIWKLTIRFVHLCFSFVSVRHLHSRNLQSSIRSVISHAKRLILVNTLKLEPFEFTKKTLLISWSSKCFPHFLFSWSLPANIAKYGFPNSEWVLLYQALDFFTNPPQYKTAHIPNFILAVPSEIIWTNEVCNLQMQSPETH